MSASDSSLGPFAALRERSRWLGRFAHNVHSQTGEDGVLAKVEEILGSDLNRVCVDVGAWDGIHGSNTRQLILAGWRSLQIEGHPQRHAELARLYAHNDAVQCLCRFVQCAGPDALDPLLDAAGIPKEFGLLAIDIDGNDWHLWHSLVHHQPQLVLVEYNFTIPDEVSFVQPADSRVSQGASLRAFVELARQKGYELIHTTGLNALFVAGRYFPRFNIPDNCLEVMHGASGGKQTQVFFGYDGTVFVRGEGRLPWHDLPFPEHHVQVLPRYLRQIGGYNRLQRLWFLWIRARLQGDWRRPRKLFTALRVLFGKKRVTNVPNA